MTDKLTQITDRIYCCRSGSAADTQAIADIVKYYLDIHQLAHHDTLAVHTSNNQLIDRIEMDRRAQVKTAASVFRDFCYNYRDSLLAGIIVGGWDKYEGGQVA